MAIYDINGNDLEFVYSINNEELAVAYDIEGAEVYTAIPDIPVTPMEWDMTLSYSEQIKSALNYIKSYEHANAGSYAFCQFNDVHEVYSANEPNFIDYNKGYKLLSRMLFVGDMVNNFTATTAVSSVAYMNGAQASRKLIGMGNHEYFISGGPNPETIYKTANSSGVSYMSNETDSMVFYDDDLSNNVRYIFLDYYYITRSGADDKHLLDDNQLEWCASAMENSNGKDIIIAGHSELTPFNLIRTGEEKTATYGLQNQQNLKDLINAFIDRGTYSITIDGVIHTHDFSNCTGDFILYTSGHYHALGYKDFGFNMFTTPTLLSNATNGFVIFIIDTTAKKIILMVLSKTLGQFELYDYTY